ncbi:GLPGLI family protein [Crocinitomix catalasitica]|nr:GLPGLI family protein [Crocinitomix catalasitica]
MKNILLALSISVAAIAVAQAEGEVTYTTKIDLHASLPEGENAEMLKSMIPQFSETKSTLLFTSTESLYQSGVGTSETEEEALNDDEQNVTFRLSFDQADEKIYTDVENGLVVEQREMMDKVFLIKDTINPAKWKMTSETKAVSGLTCMKATMESDDGTIEAWFTPQIPVSSGPAGFGGLPGLIVHLSMNDGNFTISATSIIPREIGKDEIIAPKKGKVVTREKFAELEKKKMEQMQKQYSGSGDGNVIMITN